MQEPLIWGYKTKEYECLSHGTFTSTYKSYELPNEHCPDCNIPGRPKFSVNIGRVAGAGGSPARSGSRTGRR